MSRGRLAASRVVAVFAVVTAAVLAGCAGSSGAGSSGAGSSGAGSSGAGSSGAGAPTVSGSSGDSGSSVFQGAGLTPPQHRPSFTLTDTAGKRFSFASVTAGHPTLLYFGYTNCPDVCPTTMADISQALTRIPGDVAKRTYVVFVSTDVERDTSPVIRQWLSNFSTGTPGTWVGLRGTQHQIDAAQTAARVSLAEDGGATHSAQTLLYGPDDYAHVSFLQSDSLRNQIVHDLPLVAGGDS